jgi:hypothetical protein
VDVWAMMFPPVAFVGSPKKVSGDD